MDPHRYWYKQGKILLRPPISERIDLSLANSGNSLHIRWRTSGTRIPFFEEQYHYLEKRISLSIGEINFDFSKNGFKSEIKRLLHRNRVFKGAILHIVIKKDPSGPEDSSCLYLFTEEYPDENFTMNSRGINLAVFKDIRHPGKKFLEWSEHNLETKVFWENELRALNTDAAYLLNSDGNIVESPDSNIFLIKNTNLYTPSADLGLHDRSIRQALIRIAPELGLKVIETNQLQTPHMDAADEIFLANDLDGIKWVVAHNASRYYKTYSEIFNNKLNREWLQSD